MGYDCTLHAVDEKEISRKLVPALVSGTPPKNAFSGEDEELWEQTMKSLAEDSPSDAASIVCQLALIFASQSHPYHYERGFALSLWPRQPDGLNATFPEELTDSPRLLFADLLEKYPRLEFPADFSGNWSTGTFIPAKKVPKAFKWIEARVKQYAEGDQRLFRGLLLVLQHCAEHKLAYWEATDLPVPMATMSPPADEKRRGERAFKWPDDYGFEPMCRRGNLFVCQDCLGAGSEEAKTALADFSTWPPSVQWLPEYAVDAAFSPSGKFVTVAADPGEYLYTVRLRSSPADANFEVLALPDSGSVGRTGYYSCAFLGEQVVANLWYERKKTPKRYPLFQEGSQLLEDKGFRPAKDLHKSSYDIRRSEDESLRVFVAGTGDGTEVLIWGEHGHELASGNQPAEPKTFKLPGFVSRLFGKSETTEPSRFKKTFDLVETVTGWDWSSVPAGPDGFFYIGNRLLYEVHRGAASIQHLPKLTNVMIVRPGPDGSLFLKEGDSKAGDWGKLYWPESKEMIRLKPDLLPEMDPDRLRDLFWLEDKRRLLAFFDEEVWFVPWEEIEKLPRSKVQ